MDGVNTVFQGLSLVAPSLSRSGSSADPNMIFTSPRSTDDEDKVVTYEFGDDDIWCKLPAEMAIRCFKFVGDVDMLGIIARINRCSAASSRTRYTSSSAGLFLCREVIWRDYANAIYPQQFEAIAKKLMVKNQIKNDGGLTTPTAAQGNRQQQLMLLGKYLSWKHMLLERPRLRTNGFYTLSTLYSRAPSQDYFWEEKRTKSVEVHFYRHMRFYNNGDVLYSLSIKDPWDNPFHNMQLIPKKVYAGRYTAKGAFVQVTVNCGYSIIKFDLLICHGKESYSQYNGNHSVLRITKHIQESPENSGDDMSWELPLPTNCDLRFWQHSYYRPTHFLRET